MFNCLFGTGGQKRLRPTLIRDINMGIIISTISLISAGFLLILTDIFIPILAYGTRQVKFVQKSLLPDEKISAIAKTSWVVMLEIVVFQLFITALCYVTIYWGYNNFFGNWYEPLCIIAFGFFIFSFPLLSSCREWLREYVATNKRIIIKRGILSRETHEFRFDKIESCDVEQGIIGRLFQYGDITIRGTGSKVITEECIDNPFKFRQYIIEKIDNEEKGAVTNAQPYTNTAQLNSIEELREYKKLLDEGIISKEDFDKKKQEILGRK